MNTPERHDDASEIYKWLNWTIRFVIPSTLDHLGHCEHAQTLRVLDLPSFHDATWATAREAVRTRRALMRAADAIVNETVVAILGDDTERELDWPAASFEPEGSGFWQPLLKTAMQPFVFLAEREGVGATALMEEALNRPDAAGVVRRGAEILNAAWFDIRNGDTCHEADAPLEVMALAEVIAADCLELGFTEHDGPFLEVSASLVTNGWWPGDFDALTTTVQAIRQDAARHNEDG